MCGIAGIIHLDGAPVERTHLTAMADALAHRGPDGDGVAIHGAIGLAHRRLAVIDPRGGSQPMTSPDGSWVIVFNGEIYNFRELRRELEGCGRTFHTSSDTEVALAAFERWGAKAPTRFRGMFAIAAVDVRNRSLVLVRDQLGIKPLLWMRVGQRLAFASEIQALRRLPWFDPTLDLEAIGQFLRFQYIPAPATVFTAVRKLAPAHRLQVAVGGLSGTPKRYWAPDWTRTDTLSEEDWIERIDATVAESVKAHLVADVPFGAFLSGGIDSTTVAAHMANALGAPPMLFTIGFREQAFDETHYAAEAAKRIGAVHRTEIVQPDALALLPTLVRHYGEPFGDASAVPTWHVSRLARRDVTMVLSGDGGDELFAGYATYASWRRWLAAESSPPWKRAGRALASRLAPRHWPPRRADPAAWFNLVSWTTPKERDGWWRPELQTTEPEPAHGVDTRGLDPLTMAQALDLETYLPSCILNKVDIASMCHSLEVRTPLVDVRVLELACRIPVGLRMERAGGGGWIGKTLLKRVAEKTYGAGFFDRPKQGFAIPMADWLTPNGSTSTGIRDRLLDQGSPLLTLLRPAGIATTVDQARPGPLWLLLVLDEFLRQLDYPVS